MWNPVREIEIAGFFAGLRGWKAGRKRGPGWGDDGLTPLAISPRQRLDDAVKTVSDLPFGGTDVRCRCSTRMPATARSTRS